MSEKKLDLKKWFRRDNLLILVLSGILLFIIALPTGRGESREEEKQAEQLGQDLHYSEEEGQDMADNDAYAACLEKRLEHILSKMAGVGNVEVMVTRYSSEELVVEKDVPTTRSSTEEKDAAGGSRIVTQTEGEEATVYRSNGSESEPYVVKTLYPKVEGVVVVAEGADSGRVNKSISDMVQVLFGLEAHRVKVVKMTSQNNVDK